MKPARKKFRCAACGSEQERAPQAKFCCRLRDGRVCHGRLAEAGRDGRCPTCGRPFDQHVPRRLCAACGKQITRRHKWHVGDDGRIRHRVCGRPQDYL